jgi:hypothetical protein
LRASRSITQRIGGDHRTGAEEPVLVLGEALVEPYGVWLQSKRRLSPLRVFLRTFARRKIAGLARPLRPIQVR